MSNIIGQTFLGQYRVDSFIASGGMGAVYKVWDLKRNVPLAMKVLHAEFADDPSSFKYFQREARALQKLRHPNVVPFYGLYQEGQMAFLLEHYIDGPSLRDILNNYKSGMPIPEALAYMQALCSALGYAHSSGVVHCDIKPSNVMVDHGGHIYLADFGIARHAESSTTTIAGAGTPSYMAPEQIRAQQVVPATDIYSLGVLLFELLTGQRPFRGDEQSSVGKGDTSGERIRYAHFYLPPPDPRGINPSIPPALAQIVMKCMAKAPEERYAFTGELLAALAMIGIDAAPRVQAPMQEKAAIRQSQKPLQPQKGAFQKNLLPVLWMVIAIFGIVTVLLGILLFSRSQAIPIPIPIESGFLPTLPSSQPVTEDQPYIAPANPAIVSPQIPPNTFVPLPPPLEIPPPSEISPPTPVPVQSNYDLAFVSDRGGSFGNLHPFVVNSNDLTNYMQFENPSGYERAQWPSFCGEKLAIEVFDVDKKKPSWIYLYESNGQNYAWNQSADGLGVPRCSPSGQYMAYSIQADGWNLAVADINSGQIVYNPDVSSYGKIPGYASWLGSSSFLFEVISPNDTYLFVNGFPSSPSIKHMPNLSEQGVHSTLSPDGTKAAFSCDEGQLCVSDLNSGAIQNIYQTRWDVKVTDWPERVTPVWSADGQWIYFATVDGGDWDIFRIRPDGRDVQNITADWTSNEIMPATR